MVLIVAPVAVVLTCVTVATWGRAPSSIAMQAGAPAQAVAKFTRKVVVTFVLTVTRMALSVPATLGVSPHPLRHVGVPVDFRATTPFKRVAEATLSVPMPR